jgi:hypothetical protein
LSFAAFLLLERLVAVFFLPLTLFSSFPRRDFLDAERPRAGFAVSSTDSGARSASAGGCVSSSSLTRWKLSA